MLKKAPERITYAQKMLISLIERRKLRQWCMDNALNHSAFYRIALGEAQPTYRTIASTSHLIAPIEWLFYTDEKLPYAPKIVPQWDCKNICAFVAKHKNDYREVAKRYGTSETAMYNLCVVRRAMPGVAFMRECCMDTNPIEFFTAGNFKETETDAEGFYPDRGDIVSMLGNPILVLSKKHFAKKSGNIVGCPIIAQGGNGIELKGHATRGFVAFDDLRTFALGARARPKFIETADEKLVEKVLSSVRKIFED